MTESFIDLAAEECRVAGIGYLKRHTTVKKVVPLIPRLVELLLQELEGALPVAVRDVEDSETPDEAELRFRTTMACAGIRAAKRLLGKP